MQLQAIQNDHSYAKSQVLRLSSDSANLAGTVMCHPGNTASTENFVTGYGQNSQPNHHSSTPSNATITAGQNHITVDSVCAMQELIELIVVFHKDGSMKSG